MLLLYYNEEYAFIILASICEELVPGYYTRSMIGSLVDVEVMAELVRHHLPQVYAKLNRIGGVTVLIVPWFMCLYLNCLPWKVWFILFYIYLGLFNI
jgi:TBC1 domain family member 8/9